MDFNNQRVLRYLQSYVTQNIWNEEHQDYRNNIKLSYLHTRSQTNYFYLFGKNHKLPDNGPYYVFYFDKNLLFDLSFNYEDKWYSGNELINDKRRYCELISREGKSIPKDNFYLNFNLLDEYFVIIINKKAYKKLNIKSLDIYLKTWKDIVKNTNLFVENYFITSSSNKNNIINKIKNNICFHNGYLVDSMTTSEIKNGDFIEILIDEDIKNKCKIDITDINQGRYYEDDLLENRFLIHIPKELNKDNKIITLNSLMIYVRRKDNHKGIIVNDAIYNKPPKQVTHNDFSIPEYLITFGKSILNTTDVYIEIHIRFPEDNDNYMEQDKYYINKLYSLSDSNIIEILCEDSFFNDIGINKPNFWKASFLENTNYLKTLYDFSSKDHNFNTYVNILGLFKTLSLIAINKYNLKINTTFTEIWLRKDLLWQDIKTIPLIFKDGVKINNDNFTYEDNTETGMVSINFNEDYNGDNLIHEIKLLEHIPNNGLYKKPIIDDMSIDINYTDFVIYKRINFPIFKSNGMDHKIYNFYWDKINNISDILFVENIDEENKRLTFKNTEVDNEFVIYPKYEIDNGNITYNKYNLENKLINNQALVINLIFNENIPVININENIVFFNGYYLTEGIDYKIEPLYLNGKLCFNQLCIYTIEYINYDDITKNDIEVYTLSGKSLFKHKDFLIYENKDILPFAESFFKGLSDLYIRGKSINNFNVYTNYISNNESDKSKPGTLYSLFTRFNKYILDQIPQFQLLEHIQIMLDVMRFLNGHIGLTQKEILLIPEEYHLYSIYTQNLIEDLINGEIEIPKTFSNETTKIHFYFYEHIKNRDIIFNKSVNLDFIDMEVVHTPVNVTAKIYKQIQQIKEILPIDKVEDKE
jgi:hypothetical protein